MGSPVLPLLNAACHPTSVSWWAFCMAKTTGQRKSNPNAELAFAEYVNLGSGRSLEKLCDLYRSRTDSVPTKHLTTLKTWSIRYAWQNRIADAVTARSQRMLADASDLDADTFLLSSRLLNERMRYATRDHADSIVKWRESVRKPQPKSGTSVNVKVSVEVRHLAEQMAQRLGISADELLRDADAIASNAWDAS